jgi:hypothetical protein
VHLAAAAHNDDHDKGADHNDSAADDNDGHGSSDDHSSRTTAYDCPAADFTAHDRGSSLCLFPHYEQRQLLLGRRVLF